MPRSTPDIIDAASRCFHFNMSMLVPDYIVIYSPSKCVYAVTTIGLFTRYQLHNTTDDWHIAIQLDSPALMSLMAIIPPKPNDFDDLPLWKPDPPTSEPSPEIREVHKNAGSPQDI
jgi:hypothetical protein